jgi:hypothetical protein
LDIDNIHLNNSIHNLESLDVEIHEEYITLLDEKLVSLSLCQFNKDNETNNEDDDDNDEEIDINILKKMVVRWIKLDDTIKEYNTEIKDFKNALSSYVKIMKKPYNIGDYEKIIV